MIYDVVYSAESRRDLRNIYEYIAYELLVPEIAASQVDRFMKAARSLEQMPMRYTCYEEEPWHSQGLRFLPLDNYVIFYLPDETTSVVNIIRIMYGGRDVKRQLSETIED